ncbi:AraC family transcriptional regulator [Levilactobacillus brevis]|nr:AraC family transcriptional regulator [Levilactobacillus brevis]
MRRSAVFHWRLTISKNIQRPISLNEVAQRAYLSPSYLSRLFKNTFTSTSSST